MPILDSSSEYEILVARTSALLGADLAFAGVQRGQDRDLPAVGRRQLPGRHGVHPHDLLRGRGFDKE